LLGLWTLKGGWVPSMLILPAYTFHRLGIFPERLGVVEGIHRGNSKYGSWVHCSDHPQGLSPSIPSPPTPSQSNHKSFLFVCPRRMGSPSTTTPHLDLLLSPSTLPEVAQLLLTHTQHTHTRTRTRTRTRTHTHTHTHPVHHL
jgi:hypothetical protein